MTTPQDHPFPCPLGRLGDDDWNDATAANFRAAGHDIECTCNVPRAVLKMRNLVGRLELQSVDADFSERPLLDEAREVLEEVERLAKGDVRLGGDGR